MEVRFINKILEENSEELVYFHWLSVISMIPTPTITTDNLWKLCFTVTGIP